MLQLLFAVAFSAVPLTLYMPPIRSLNLFVETIEELLHRTSIYTLSAFPRIRLAFSRILNSITIRLSRVGSINLWSLMDEDASNRASSLPWIWVIEALASFKQVDISVLHDLIELTPELPDDLGKNMREMLALRCLEYLFGPTNGTTTLDSKVGFDFSKSCEDVLQCILHETSLSDLKMARPELVKWDVHPFVTHKRACMPKLALQQLKDSILEGIHPYADSLKERSGLAFTSAGDGIPVNNGNHNALTNRVSGSCFDTQLIGAKGNSRPRILENGNQLLEKDPCNRNLLLSKRERNGSTTENMVGDFHENQNILNDCDDLHISAKRQKPCAYSAFQSIEENPVPLHGTEMLEDSSARVMPVTEREGCDLVKDHIGTLKEGMVLEDVHDEHTASVRCGHNSDDAFHNNESETHTTATMMLQDPSADDTCQNISVNKDKDDSEHSIEPRSLIGSLPPYSATVMVQDTCGDEPCQKISIDEVKDDSEYCAEPRTSSGPLLNKTLEDDFHHNQSETPDSITMMLQDPFADEPCQNISVNKDKDDSEHCVEPRPFTGSLSPYCAAVMVQDMSGDEPCQNNSVDEVKDDSEHCAEPRISSGPLLNKTLDNETQCNRDHDFQQAQYAASLDGSQQKIIADEAEVMDRCCEAETSSDSDEFHNDRIDVSKKKHEFLHSQCTYGHDSLASAGCTDHSFCMRCNEGGQLLVCNTSNCPVVVHENCLGFPSRFDNNENFYCPFCAYSLAISEYLEAKKKVSLAKKELSKFTHMGLKHQSKELIERVHIEKHFLSRQSGNEDPLVKSHDHGHLEEIEGNQADHGGEHVNEVNNLHCRRSMDDIQQAEPSESCENVNSPLREEEAAVTTGTLNELTKEKKLEEKVIQECLPLRALKGHNQEPADHEDDGDNLSCENTDFTPVNQRQVEEGIQQEVLGQQIADPPQEPFCALNIDAEETSGDEINKSIIHDYSIRFRRRERHYTYPAIPQLRRKKVPWTAEEEEILKEGVQKFSDANDRWKKILEFGGDVLKDRTTIDLKDKWRNMCKRSPKPKS